jgi:hypothetical protein
MPQKQSVASTRPPVLYTMSRSYLADAAVQSGSVAIWLRIPGNLLSVVAGRMYASGYSGPPAFMPGFFVYGRTRVMGPPIFRTDRIAKGRKLATLRDAALYITKAEHDAAEWQAAMEALLLVAEHDGPTMFARIGVTRALTVTSSGCSTSTGKTSIGDAGSWRGIDDSDRKVLRRHRSSQHGSNRGRSFRQ